MARIWSHEAYKYVSACFERHHKEEEGKINVIFFWKRQNTALSYYDLHFSADGKQKHDKYFPTSCLWRCIPVWINFFQKLATKTAENIYLCMVWHIMLLELG